jgi:hypothetical protein
MNVRGFNPSLLANAESVPNRPFLKHFHSNIPTKEPEQLSTVTNLWDERPVNRGSICEAARDLPPHRRDHSWSATPIALYPMRTEEPFPMVNPPKREAERSPTTIKGVNA